MVAHNWTDADTERALEIWADYQQRYNVDDRTGETAGIDPTSGQVRFGDSAKDIFEQMEQEGVQTPLYFIRVGHDHYIRKGPRR